MRVVRRRRSSQEHGVGARGGVVPLLHRRGGFDDVEEVGGRVGEVRGDREQPSQRDGLLVEDSEGDRIVLLGV
jgi:hypothetical protein